MILSSITCFSLISSRIARYDTPEATPNVRLAADVSGEDSFRAAPIVIIPAENPIAEISAPNDLLSVTLPIIFPATLEAAPTTRAAKSVLAAASILFDIRVS